jgi:hypothetical protein
MASALVRKLQVLTYFRERGPALSPTILVEEIAQLLVVVLQEAGDGGVVRLLVGAEEPEGDLAAFITARATITAAVILAVAPRRSRVEPGDADRCSQSRFVPVLQPRPGARPFLGPRREALDMRRQHLHEEQGERHDSHPCRASGARSTRGLGSPSVPRPPPACPAGDSAGEVAAQPTPRCDRQVS